MKILLVISIICFLNSNAYISKFKLVCKLMDEVIPPFKSMLGKVIEFISMILIVVSLMNLFNIDWYWCILIGIALNVLIISLYIPLSIKNLQQTTSNSNEIIDVDLYMVTGIISLITGVICLLITIFL